MLNPKLKLTFIAITLLFTGCASNNINNSSVQNSSNSNQILSTSITSENSNLNNTKNTITNSNIKKPRGSYKLAENTPAFIVDFIKNNVEIDNPEAVATLLMQQEANQQVVKLVSPASQPLRKNWLVYKSKFIEPTRIKSGVNFWNQNSELLAKVENEFQVDASVIVGIIGVESIFGKHMGNFNVLNTLYTLAFYYPDTPNKQAREQMFQKQLANYIVWTQSNQANMYTHIGSFAGAMGMPQFMPESIQKYAIDYDNDGTINLSTSIPDVVASVANFLKQHGWKSGEKVILDVDKTPENIALLKANATGKPKPSLTFQDLPSLNFNYANNGLNPDTKLLVVDLPSGSDVDYKIGLENFYVLTRYNQSFFYALSVYELGKSIADARSSNSNQVIPIAFKSR